ncbi:MAG TPA: hypothetical protein VNT53_11495 [Pseudolysinimonas sp.]|nr:hypothetical protein [Pseudolysinimonas sp.]
MMRVVTVSVYVLLLAAAIALTLIGRRRPTALLPAESLLDEVMSTRSARVTILLFWWWLAGISWLPEKVTESLPEGPSALTRPVAARDDVHHECKAAQQMPDSSPSSRGK